MAISLKEIELQIPNCGESYEKSLLSFPRLHDNSQIINNFWGVIIAHAIVLKMLLFNSCENSFAMKLYKSMLENYDMEGN